MQWRSFRPWHCAEPFEWLPLKTDIQIGLRRKRQMRMALIWGGFLLFAAWCLNGTIIEDTDWSRIGGRNGVFASLGRYLHD